MSTHDRRKFIGGSDAAAILGVSPWATPVELWMQKTGRAAPAPIDPVRERIFARGKKLEPIVLDMVLDKLREYGHEVELLATNARYHDPEHEYMSCEIDFELMLDGQHINGDCKTVTGFARKKWGEEDTEDVPIEYAAQFMHGLMITGRPRCLVAALIGLDDVAVYWVNRDEETIAAMRAKEILFWTAHVLGDTPPDTFTFDDVKLLYPHDNGLVIEATAEIAGKVRQLSNLKGDVATMAFSEEALKHEIADFINPFSRLSFNGREIATWKGHDTSTFDEKRFKKDHPELASLYTTRGTNRVLRLNKKGIR